MPDLPAWRRGRLIKTFPRLFALAEQKRTVAFPNWTKPCPAVVVANMPAVLVYRWITGGKLRECPKKREVPA